MKLPSIKDLDDLSGKRVLVRLDLNVPINSRGEVVDDFRIRRILPTLQFLSEGGAKILAVSHIEGGEASLEPVALYLRDKLSLFSFSHELFGEQADAMRKGLRDGEVMLYENIRRYPEEEANDVAFAGRLAGLADLYVNEAFAVSHREHASIVGIPKHLPSFAGLELLEEVENLSKAFDPAQPFLFVLGGAKFDTKLPLLLKFLPIAETVFVGGAIANELLEEKGYPVGMSATTGAALHQHTIVAHENLLLPEDVLVQNEVREVLVRHPADILPTETIVDVGPATVERLRTIVEQAEFILWNGPLGFYEKGYTVGTEATARMIAESKAQSILGGGDTLAAIKKLQLEDKFSFVSTGGGAMLDFLVDGTLPGIEALDKNANR